MNHYQTLGVDTGATQQDIKAAYRRKAQELHPDKNGGDSKLFQELVAAYEVLSDPDKRARYDRGEPEPDNNGDEAQAMQFVANLVREHLAKMDNDSIFHSDMIAAMRHDVTGFVLELGVQQARNRLKRTKTRAVLRRLTSGTGFMEGVVRDQLRGLVSEALQIRRGFRLMKIVDEILADGSYRHEPKPVMPDLGGQARATNSFGGWFTAYPQ